MSYILEALRKSDQQRQLGAAPKFHGASIAASAPETRPAWQYAVLGVGFALIAFAIGWLRPWQSDPKPTPAVASAAEPSPKQVSPLPETPRPLATSSVAAPAAHAPAPATSRQSTVDSNTVAEARPPKPASRDPKPSVRKSAESGSERPSSEARKGPVPSEKVQAYSELPAAVRQELPPISVSVHAYSLTPKDRLVGINDKLLHEGDTVANNLVLERITPDGMVLNYKGTRFQRGVQ